MRRGWRCQRSIILLAARAARSVTMTHFWRSAARMALLTFIFSQPLAAEAGFDSRFTYLLITSCVCVSTLAREILRKLRAARNQRSAKSEKSAGAFYHGATTERAHSVLMYGNVFR